MIASFFSIVDARERLIKSEREVTVDNILHELGGAISRSSIKLKLGCVAELISRPPLISRDNLHNGSRLALQNMRDKLAKTSHAVLAAELERLMIYVVPELQMTIACLEKQVSNSPLSVEANGNQKPVGEYGECYPPEQMELANDCLVFKLHYRNKASNEIEIEVSGSSNECEEALVYSQLDLTTTSRSQGADNTVLQKLLAAQAFVLHQENIDRQKMLNYHGTLMQEIIEMHACIQKLEAVVNRLRSPD